MLFYQTFIQFFILMISLFMPKHPARASSGRYVSRLTSGTLAVIMAGGRGERLKALTDHRCKPATPFGGKFRIIDFVLSNCVNSGIRQICLLTQYKAQSLIQHARTRGVLLFGDIPIYVAHDSVEVWAHRENFQLDAACQPVGISGVPPDYFSADGQVWGNPLYDWPAEERDGFKWWVARFATQLERFDLLRIDHFRGLESYWAIPAGARTGRDGEWRAAPGEKLLQCLKKNLRGLPVVAEDLGVITPEVERLRDQFHLPGMRILQFAFDGSATNPYLPHNHVRHCVVYTGTHDNDTTRGWSDSLDGDTRQRVADYYGVPAAQVPHALMRSALASVARLAVLPLQDLLGLDSRARMNTPATTTGNWTWVFSWDQLPHVHVVGNPADICVMLSADLCQVAGVRDERIRQRCHPPRIGRLLLGGGHGFIGIVTNRLHETCRLTKVLV